MQDVWLMIKTVYLDNAATTQVDKKVLEVMNEFALEKYGNASSLHKFGVEARSAIEEARKVISKSINASAEEIFFTSGGTEGNNWALKGIAFANRKKGNHIVTTKVEHKSVLESCKWLEEQGFKVTYVNVDSEGFVKLDELERAINDKTILVSVIHGNNEIGAINDLEKIGAICKKKGVYFHTDACQSYTKVPIDVKKMNLSLVSLNGHKIHGPKGIGALYVNEDVKIGNWQQGGFQEKGMRAGTENVSGIVGFAEAVKLASEKRYVVQMSELRDKLIEGILMISNVRLNGPGGKRRLCNSANFSFGMIEGESIVGMLDLLGVCASTGSACSERTLELNYVLKAMGLTHEMINGSLRLTLSRFTTEQEIDYLLKILPQIVSRLREISPFKEEKNVLK
jgi:cysteine desulfurase